MERAGLIDSKQPSKHRPDFTKHRIRIKKELLKSVGIGDAPISPSLSGRKVSGAHGLSAEFKAIMLKAGVRGQIVQHNKGGRRNEMKSFHSLRHSFNSALANKGVDLTKIRLQATASS